jgi:hypothetical protein
MKYSLVDKRSSILFGAAILLVTLGNAKSFAQTLDKVKIALPDFSISFLPLRVAQTQGFYQREGLEAEMIRISNPVAMIALMNKELDYAASTGSVLDAAVLQCFTRNHKSGNPDFMFEAPRPKTLPSRTAPRNSLTGSSSAQNIRSSSVPLKLVSI